MPLTEKLIKFTVRLPERTKQKLERRAKAAGVSQSDYLCKLVEGKSLSSRPPEEFWDLMQSLYHTHRILLEASQYNEHYRLTAEDLEDKVMALMELFTAPGVVA